MAQNTATSEAPAGWRVERDSMGEMLVPQDALWGAQTERSHENFPIGTERMPDEIVRAFAQLKAAAARANCRLGRMSRTDADLIGAVADEILAGKLDGNFPLVVWQTGSGTQSNMNVNEVIANRGNQIAGERRLHPNDSVNMSQSSNDTFPTAMHIAAVTAVRERLLPAVARLTATFRRLEVENADVVKSGRTHLQDAVPISFAQEISGWRGLLEGSAEELEASLAGLYRLALGGTAVGTGLNAPEGFDVAVAEELAAATGMPFVTDPNKFRALTGKDAIVFAHGAVKGLAANMMKIANDVRWLASGPRLGLGEITIPANEPGSSIMPGNEQREMWGSRSADAKGSYNVIGIKNPVVDALIEGLIQAQEKEDYEAHVRALDRVLLNEHYVIFQWYSPYNRVAYQNKFGHPQSKIKAGYQPFTWWMKETRTKGRK